MTHKIVPREESRKLTTEQLIGRKVVINIDIDKIPEETRGVGVVLSVVGESNGEAVRVKWDSGEERDHGWNWTMHGLSGIYHLDLLDETPAPGAPKPYSEEARLFFGAPPTDTHPLLRLRDTRRTK